MSRLSLEKVSKRFGETAALEAVSITVEDGEFFTLVGPSGCGKTTTLRIIAGLTEPTTGRVTFDGRDMTDVPPERRDVGIVFQNYALFPHLSVAENIAYGLRFRDPPGGVGSDERVAALLDLVELPGMGERDPTELSGGQQQRVALARALAPGPGVLLLDEPMSALDARLREDLRRTVRDVQTELDITTVYVTHDQAEALAISDRIAVLSDGRVEQVGTPAAVYHEPATRFVAAFVGENNLFSIDRIEDVGGRRVARIGDWTVAVPESASAEDLLAVRPEAMHLGPDDTTFEGVVERTEFLGDAYLLHCRVDDRSVVLKSGSEPAGTTVTVGFSSDAATLVGDG